jgi:hypothetical protein
LIHTYVDYFHQFGNRGAGTPWDVPTRDHSKSSERYVVPEQAGRRYSIHRYVQTDPDCCNRIGFDCGTSDLFTCEGINLLIKLPQVEANIDEWLSGTKVPVTFWADEYRPIYSSHIEGLKEYGEHTAKYNLLGRLQRRLYNYGWYVSLKRLYLIIWLIRFSQLATMQVYLQTNSIPSIQSRFLPIPPH